VLLFAVTPVCALAGSITTYSNVDAVGPGVSHPHTTAAMTSFDTAAGSLGTVNTVTFTSTMSKKYTSTESVTTNSGDVTFTSNEPYAIEDDANATSLGEAAIQTLGFATETDGYFIVNEPTAKGTDNEVFTFLSPIDAFGAFFTGLQPDLSTDSLTFSDGSSESFTIPSNADDNGGVSYLGFTDPGAMITSVTVSIADKTTTPDHFGVSNVQFVNSPSPTPEPSQLTAMFIGAGFLAFLMRKGKTAFRQVT
jgi:hypothetical protein